MNKFFLTLSLLCFVAFLQPGFANETLILKNGEKVEGTIVMEDENQVVIDVNVTASISERKTYPTEEIEEVQRLAPDAVDFESISKLQLSENSSTLETYDRVMNEILDPFVRKYPDSEHRAAVEKLREVFFEERGRVAEGEVKLDGNWLTAEEVEKRRAEIDARVAYNTMRDAASRGDHIATLNAFDVIERDYKGQLIYPEAVTLAQGALNAISRDVPRLIEAHAIELKEWQVGVERTRETRRQPLIDARAQEEASYEARITRATSSGLRWPPLISRSIKSLEEIQRLATAESTKLQQMKVTSMLASAEKTREAQASAANTRYERAGELAAEALTLWPENAVAKNLQTELPALQEAHEKAIADAIEAEAAAEAAESEEAAEEAQKEADEAAAARQAEQAAAAAATSQPVTAGVEEKPFFMTIQGAIVIVVGVLVVVTVSAIVNKARTKPTSDIEA